MDNIEYDKAIGNRIKYIRILLDMTVEKVASQLQITRQTLYNYESGKTSLKISVLYQLCKIYDVNPNLIVGFSDCFTIPEANIRIYFPSISLIETAEEFQP